MAIGMKEEMPFSRGKYPDDLKMWARAIPQGLIETPAVRLAKRLSQYPRISPFGVIRPLSRTDHNGLDPAADRAETPLWRREIC